MTWIRFFGPFTARYPEVSHQPKPSILLKIMHRSWMVPCSDDVHEGSRTPALYSNGFMMMVSRYTHVPLGTMPAKLSSKRIDRISYTRVCPVMVSWHTCPSRGDDGRPQLSTKAPISYSALDSWDYASVGESSPTLLTRGWRQSAGGLVLYQSSYLVKPQEPARSPPSHPNTCHLFHFTKRRMPHHISLPCAPTDR